MLITFVLLATIAFGLLTYVWNGRDSWLDLMIKGFLFTMTVWGTGIILSNPTLFLVSP
jgi:hypothetical protein